MFDYETLKLIWWALVGVLLIGFALTDGFDLGVGALLRIVGKNDDERRVIINCVGPTWDGNQVWLILGAGAVFAAWPVVYAVSFSVLYPAMLAALFALFFRPTGFEYRSKLTSLQWRGFWDWALTAGGALPAIVFGAAFGLMLTGIPFHFDAEMRVVMDGGILDTLSPFAILAGLVSLAMLMMHGAAFLNVKTRAAVQTQARQALRFTAIAFIVLFALAGYWVIYHLQGYHIATIGNMNAGLAPTDKHVVMAVGAWMQNFYDMPWMWIAPAMGFVGALAAIVLSALPVTAFLATGISVTGVVLTAGFALFPFMLPSSSMADHSLTVWDSSSSEHSLWLMVVAAVIFVPLILAYTTWVYRVLRGPVLVEDVRRDEYGMY
ncbi:cytochrome d ubiquinol oxidase subunit II [Mariprofundus ferrooxydans]|uniref:cytochrome d ubiquinol oxidase subunit II n=1 Tax=Mariprofundus ferrooxydans TaxID=314344 RepID=UPI00142FED5E|nr:cytochrome d ubiquinol oxidase subunit II [Mariprofundus ferrooxydans]